MADENLLKKIDKISEKDKNKPSPIDINVANSRKVLQSSCLEWNHYENKPRKLKITNNGETLVLSMKWIGERPYLFGGFLRDHYYLARIHFHWGKTPLEGSEHTIEGRSYPLELHALHCKNGYKTLADAWTHDDGVVIVVYLYDIQFNHNPSMHLILSNLVNIREANTSFEIEPFLINNLLKPFSDDYFMYWGSLQGMSDETGKRVVQWIVSRNTLGVSVEQLKLFHMLYDHKGKSIDANFHQPPIGEKRQRLYHVNPKYEFTNSTLAVLPNNFNV